MIVSSDLAGLFRAQNFCQVYIEGKDPTEVGTLNNFVTASELPEDMVADQLADC